MSLIKPVNNRQTVFTFRLLIHMTEIYSSIAGHHRVIEKLCIKMPEIHKAQG